MGSAAARNTVYGYVQRRFPGLEDDYVVIEDATGEQAVVTVLLTEQQVFDWNTSLNNTANWTVAETESKTRDPALIVGSIPSEVTQAELERCVNSSLPNHPHTSCHLRKAKPGSQFQTAFIYFPDQPTMEAHLGAALKIPRPGGAILYFQMAPSRSFAKITPHFVAFKKRRPFTLHDMKNALITRVRKYQLGKINPILIRPKCKNNVQWCIWVAWTEHEAAIRTLNEYGKSGDQSQALTIEPAKDKPSPRALGATGPTPPT
jgi:hypothetical protein